MRDILNIIDESIVMLLGRRYEICRKVGLLKKHHGIPMMQPERVQEVINRCIVAGENANVPAELTEKIYKLIIEHACAMETEIIDA